MMQQLRRAAVALALTLSAVTAAFGQASQGSSPLSGAKGGTGNGFMQFTGPASSIKTYGLPNTSDTIATIAAAQTLTNKTMSGSSNTFSNIGNSSLAAMAAYTLKCNNTGSSAAPTDCDVTAMTSKPSPASNDVVLIQSTADANAFRKTTVSALSAAGSVASLNGQTGTLSAFFPPQGRLTLVSGTPVMTSSTTGASTIYYTPYVGNMVLLYDGTNTVPTVFTELSITLGNNWTSSTNYDVFIASDSGTTRACTGPAWTAGSGGSATARGTGAGGTELERVAANGLLMNKVQITCRYTNSSTFTVNANRGTYVGTVSIRAADQTIDWSLGGASSGGTAGNLGVWNMFNRREVTAMVEDTLPTPATVSTGVAALNGSTNNRISYVIGWAEDIVTSKAMGQGAAGSSGFLTMGVCHDAANAYASGSIVQGHGVNLASGVGGSARFNGDLGFHYAQACQGAITSNGNIYGSGTVGQFHVGMELTGMF